MAVGQVGPGERFLALRASSYIIFSEKIRFDFSNESHTK